MIQYLRLKDSKTIVHPPEIVDSKEHAEEMWGKGKSVKVNIKSTDDPFCFSEKLVGGKVVIDKSKLSVVKLSKNKIDKRNSRSKAIASVKKQISSKNFDVNKLTPFELKVMFGIDGGPTDEDLGIL